MKINNKSALLTLILALVAPVFVSAPAQAALGVSAVTSSPMQTPDKGFTASVNCTSPRVISSISSYTGTNDGGVLVGTYASCATLASTGLTISATGAETVRPYANGTDGFASVACSSTGGNRVLVGAKVYKTPVQGWTAGVQLLCGTLPNGGSRSYTGAVIGKTTASFDEIACNTGSVAIGLRLYHGGILDRFGMNCAALTGSGQNITISTLGTSSKTYPYSQALSMSTTDTLGSGAITYAISSGGTAASCALSNSSNSATITAASSGTCLIKATIAAGGGYESGTSSDSTFTFSAASQAALSLTSLSGSFGSALTLTTSGGNGSGAVSYVYAAGTTTCSLSGSTLTANDTGTCLITATKAADANYDSVTATQATVTFVAGLVTATLTIAPGTFVFRQAKLITVVAGAAGKVTFSVAGKVLPGCKNKAVNAGNSYTTTCSYRPSNRSYIKVTVTLVPTSLSLTGVATDSAYFLVENRAGAR